MMVDFVKINGTPVHIAGFKQRVIDRPNGQPVRQFELVVILRDATSHQQFLGLLGDRIRLEIPDDASDAWQAFETELLDSFHTATESGPATIYRHEITLRESTDQAEPIAGDPVPEAAGHARLELRLEALIDTLVDTGIVDRTRLDATYAKLRQRIHEAPNGQRLASSG